MRYEKFSFAIVLFAMSVAATGCGTENELGRLRVSGSVTLNSQPLDQGQIEFTPSQSTGVSGGTMIADGKYEISEQKGLPPGTYTVRIYSTDEKATKVEGPPGESEVSAIERIPANYNVNSEITVEVTTDGENKFDFTIE